MLAMSAGTIFEVPRQHVYISMSMQMAVLPGTDIEHGYVTDSIIYSLPTLPVMQKLSLAGGEVTVPVSLSPEPVTAH